MANKTTRVVLALTLVAIAVFVASRLGGAGFESGVVIPPENYEVSDLTCTSRVAEAVRDGETVDEVQWLGEATLTNVLAEWSPVYDMHYSATFDDGTEREWSEAALVFPLAPGDSQSFTFLVSPIGKTPVECRVQAQDSVLNYD